MGLKDQLIDSFSDSQFDSKIQVMDALNKTDVLSKQPVVMIWGSWFASIIVPMLLPYASKIYCVDLDEKANLMNKRLHKDDKIEVITKDVFKEGLGCVDNTDLFINTSGEHMPPLNEYEYLRFIKSDAIFLIQSNNMFGIEGHVNCSKTIEDFKKQMPTGFEIIYESSIPIREYHRYSLVLRKS